MIPSAWMMRLSKVVGILCGTAVFVPVGAYLQWYLPGDGIYECYVVLASAPILALAVASRHIYLRMLGSGSKGQARCFYIATVALVVMLVEVAVFTFMPPVSRRIGPWAELRSLLIEKSEDVARTRRALGIPADRYLTLNEVKYIESAVLNPYPSFTFPIINKTVRIRVLQSSPPYVGVDYGNGRNAAFELHTMLCIYVD